MLALVMKVMQSVGPIDSRLPPPRVQLDARDSGVWPVSGQRKMMMLVALARFQNSRAENEARCEDPASTLCPDVDDLADDERAVAASSGWPC
jgi:hypothetical protein